MAVNDESEASEDDETPGDEELGAEGLLGDPARSKVASSGEPSDERRSPIADALALFFAGLASGWLIGLSVQPLSEGMITTVLGMVTTLTAILAGIQPFRLASGKGLRLNPQVVAALAVGLAVGSSGGVYARSHHWLSSDRIAGHTAAAPNDAGSGEGDDPPEGRRPDASTTERADAGPTTAAQGAVAELSPATLAMRERMEMGILYGDADSDWCARLLTASDEELKTRAIAAVPQPQLSCMACATNNLEDMAQLRQVVETTCRADQDDASR